MLKSARRVIALLLLLVLTATACTSDGEDAGNNDVDASTNSTDDTAPPPTIDLDTPVDPEAVRQLAGSLTGAAVESDDLVCLVDKSDGDSQLTAVFNGFAQPGFEFTPEAFTALAVSVHGCMATEILSASLLTLSGADDDASRTAYFACINEQLTQEPIGDLAYTGLSALAVSFPVPEGAQDAAIEATSECVSAAGLANRLGANQEQALAFTVDVDRACVSDGLDADVLHQFWVDEVERTGPTDGIDDLLDGCSAEYDSGLAKEIPADFTPFSGEGTLALVDPALRNGLYNELPEMTLEDGVDYQAVISTETGDITLDLFEDSVPITVNAFVNLARDGFYDRTRFHRVIDGFMVQAGDPMGTGGGGPGYSFDDEEAGLVPIDRRGLLAMANSGPNSNGSQFFITFGAADWLDGLHTVFGEVIEGDELLDGITRRDPQAPTNRGDELVSVTILEK